MESTLFLLNITPTRFFLILHHHNNKKKITKHSKTSKIMKIPTPLYDFC